jgi:hypothetical protein
MKFPELPDIPGVPREVLKPLSLLAIALVVWVVAWSVWSGMSDLESRSRLQQRRFEDLMLVIKKYRSLPGREERASLSDDPIVVVSSLVDNMGLKENLVQISSLSRGLSVQLGRLYSENALNFILELGKRGLVVDSAELRAVPEDGVRLLSMNLVVTVAR